MSAQLIFPSALRLALLADDEPSKADVVGLGRLLAAFYLDYPLFVPRPGGAYPSLFLWSQLDEKSCPSGSSLLNREELGQELPAEYGPRTPAVLLTHCGLVLEAILYCDHFSDLRSSILLRIFADKQYGLSLCQPFLEDLWTAQLGRQLDLFAEEEGAPERAIAFCQRYVQSALELDVFDDGSDLSRLQAFAVSQMENLFAQLQLKVQDTSILPRPPVYCAQNTRAGESLELRIFAKLHLYLQLLLVSLQKTNRISIEINRVHTALSEDVNTTQQSRSVLTQVLVLVLRTIYRDQFSLAIAEKRSDVPTIAAKYNTLIRDDVDDVKQLQPWMELASENDREHINRFLVFITERFPGRNDLPPLTRLSSQVWREAMFHQQSYETRNLDWLSTVLNPPFTVPPAIYNRMAFIATEWTTPLAMDASLIPLLLRLHPNDICSPSPSVPARPCVSARPSSRAAQQDSAERIFSPRVDIIAQYAERGRHLLGKSDNRATVDNEKRIKALLKKLKRSAKIQKELEHDVSEEKSFLESLPSSRTFKSNDEFKPARLERVPQKPDTYLSLKSATDAVGRELQRLSTKLGRVKPSIGIPNADTSSVTDSQQTEEFAEAEDVESTADEGEQFEGESLDPLPLVYDDTVAVDDPLPEISRLDLSLLSPAVDIQTRNYIDFTTPKKNSPPRTLALPEWMRLLPLGETNSSRLPLLQYSPPVARKSKTERCRQTQGFRSEIVDSACQTTDEERNPSDSGFLDTVERSPRKKIEIVHPMSKQNIQEMLSQM